MSRAIFAGFMTGIVGGAFVALAIRILVALPFASRFLDLFVLVGTMAGLGYVVGEAVRYGSGKKIDRRLKYVTATGVFAGWAAAAGFVPLFGGPPQAMIGTGGIIGLIVGFYVAAMRVRV